MNDENKDMNEMNEMNEDVVVVLTDEDGTEVRFYHLMTFDFEDSFYVALTPEEEMEGVENGDVLLLEIKEDEDGNDSYVPIEDEKKLDKIWDEFERLYYEEDDEEALEAEEKEIVEGDKE